MICGRLSRNPARVTKRKRSGFVSKTEVLERDAANAGPELPAWKAFVVQFGREAGSRGPFSGRVEHLSSGRRSRFATKDELIDALARLLDEIGPG